MIKWDLLIIHRPTLSMGMVPLDIYWQIRNQINPDDEDNFGAIRSLQLFMVNSYYVK